MAQTDKDVKRGSFKKGDTPTFRYEFDPPYVGYDWSTVLLDCAFTNDTDPVNNTTAAAARLNVPLTVNPDNTAYYDFQLTHTESLALVAGASYHDECQLKENGTNYLTPITGISTIKQDYVI
jgi:hypothetical protein